MKPKFLKTLAHKASRRLKRSTPTILTCLSAFGLVATTVSAVKATPKAMRLIEDAKQTDQYDLSKPEILCLTWKCYIPTVLIGTSTLACIFGANMLSRRQQAALSSAYALVSQSYKEYTDKVKELYGEETHKTIMEAIVKEKCKDVSLRTTSFLDDSTLDFDADGSDSEVHHTFYDQFSNRYFESTVSKVLQAEYHLNRNFAIRGGDGTVNEFYEFLGLAPIDGGDTIGWAVCDELMWVDFNHTKVTLDDGMEVYIVEPVFTPRTLEEWDSFPV